tara:strand:- start:292 stop:1089 length:798 start_codon:yes stop_codon:yes gene_type:complete
MNRKNIVKASKIILENRLNKTQISKLPKICEPNNYEDAYAIQNELTKSYISFKDNNIIGKKVGCTNNQAQKQLDINVPFYGNLFSKFSSISNCVINSSDFTNPFFEPEFSFKINQDIDISKFPFNTNETNSYIKCIIPSVEIVDFRFKGNIKNIGVYNLIASNGASEYWISGKKEIELKSIDLNNQCVEVFVNNKLIKQGNSSNVLGNPINSLKWLLNELAKNNQPILNNYIISTGTCTPAIKLNKNDKIKIDFKDIEIIEFEYI